MQYYWQVKNCLLDKFSHNRQIKNWLLDQFPQLARSSTNIFSRRDKYLNDTNTLKKVIKYLYATTDTAADYEYAALLCLLWYHLGHAIDLTLLRPPGHFVRSLDQGQDVRALAPKAALTPATHLIGWVGHPRTVSPLQKEVIDNPKSSNASPSNPSYVNRVLDRVVLKAGAAGPLTSHSFR
ncbi:hypothetical protein PHMEG_00012077 [Phytophthora megakarya]|uniref:Uncharacterized protein n=1 Tax=Phytophthora megakarya TaxID=4795 RepID=A0A225W9N1_9STRA|nr:hypothetical protein PHMEG_00012077 [Phytophthora megakarya]